MKSVTEPLATRSIRFPNAPQEQAGRQPQPRPLRAQHEVGQERAQRQQRYDQDQGPAPGQKAKGDPRVADVHELHAG